MATANPGALLNPNPPGSPGTPGAPTLEQLLAKTERHESYFQLVWRRFRRSRISIIGGMIVITLMMLAAFAEFFSPNPIYGDNLKDAFIPPNQVHFVDAQGNFSLRPFVYGIANTMDPKTFQVTYIEDTTKKYYIEFFARSWPYRLLGIIPTDLHLIGVEGEGKLYMLGTDKLGRDLWGKACQAGRISLTMSLFAALISIAVGSVIGVVSGYYGGQTDNVIQRFVEFVNAFPTLPLFMALASLVPKTADSFTVFIIMSCIFALLSWTTLAREVRGKVLAMSRTDFVLAAKEMGASDARIIFRHLYPNTLSHVIVILTLSIPGVILAESFLSFLGIGIQEPLTSWGLLMRNAQNLQTLSQQVWILTPTLFIIMAVLGYNFLGDGLRDAADPYASR
jgi:peptide/nickel transport system permease protein